MQPTASDVHVQYRERVHSPEQRLISYTRILSLVQVTEHTDKYQRSSEKNQRTKTPQRRKKKAFGSITSKLLTCSSHLLSFLVSSSAL